MAVAISLSPNQVTTEEQHFLLQGVSWEAYEAIGEALRDRPALRLNYDRGSLELTTISQRHELYKHWLGRFLETIAEESNIRIAPGGSMTFKRHGVARGLEPDECYWIAHEAQMRGKLEWDPEADPPPDLVLEIEITRTLVDRMETYATLRVPEVWRFDGERLRVLVLKGTEYVEVERSPTFPLIPLEELVQFLPPGENLDYLSVIRAVHEWVRQKTSNS